MEPHDASEELVESWLRTLGLDSLTQWDLLVFLYRHQTSLVGAEFIARLLGYATAPVVATLEVLESRGLVQRSRALQGVRLYQFALPADPPRRDAFERLTALANSRAGRLSLYKKLKPRDQTPQERLHASQRFLVEAQQSLRAVKRKLQLAAGQHSRDRRKEKRGQPPWRKAM
jgi:DNA-binding MarR family transcriptional regulator